MQITPGRNIAIKVPAHRWEEMLAFYRDRIGLAVRRDGPENIALAFGEITLWLDRVPQQSQVDVWLELTSDDPDAALAHLGSPQRDELEPLDGVSGHWTSDPAGVVLLLRKD
ncbi:VOC family protein [Rhodobacter sp. SY28-1]|uniref:VOC family protein n=1 Tax=Rhodobacter sp. SY28-1 TaxID=2562317 RepID=UPI0010C05DDA|nr:VOC family protein [Rhodobacter sp. SY28-1]